MANAISSPQRKISGFLETYSTEIYSRRKFFNLLYEYTLARDAMFKAADTAWVPLFVARSENKKKACG